MVPVPPVNSSFPHLTAFMGDYSNIVAEPDGVVAYWTDVRSTAWWSGHCARDQDAYFASSP